MLKSTNKVETNRYELTITVDEATFADDGEARARETYHTTARQAAKLALDAGVKKLLIGHFSARYDDEQVLLTEAKSIFEHTELAREINFYSVD